MKILLTIVVNSDIGTKNAPPLYDGIEIICPDENESEGFAHKSNQGG